MGTKAGAELRARRRENAQYAELARRLGQQEQRPKPAYVPRAERGYSYTIGDQNMGPSQASSSTPRPKRGGLSEEQRIKEYTARKVSAQNADEAYRSLRARIGQDPSATHAAARDLADRAANAHLSAREAARGLDRGDVARHGHLMEERSEQRRSHTDAMSREKGAGGNHPGHPERKAAKAPEAPKAAQTGKKGGKFVITSSGKKRYLGKSGK